MKMYSVRNIVQKPLFWIVLSLLSVINIWLAIHFFPQAFSIVNLDLQMDRSSALLEAQKVVQQFNLGPEGYQQATSFDTDIHVKNYVELEAGGKEVFNQMVQGTLYAPYTWRVRHFKEFEINEVTVSFTPDGKPYGFVETLSENIPGPNLDTQEARAIAEQKAKDDWHINFNEYKLVEESKEVQPSKRSDHTFVYERSDIKIGEGLYRLRLMVSGDKLTQLTHFVKVPEEFDRRYDEMRSANISIATAGQFAMILLYLIGGCIIGLLILSGRNWVLWKKALFWAILLAFLNVIMGINQIPLLWMHYSTELPAQGFLLQHIIRLLYSFLYMSIFYSLIFMAAESLTRRAFGNHIQLWRIWSSRIASSLPIFGRTLGSYLVVPFNLAFVVLFYLFTSRFFGWWIPSETLFDPNILATYFPWLASVIISFHAGFMEECLFRAVPLASAALLGKRLGRPKLLLSLGFIIQIIIFGALHATYATQPAYARLIELIVPSCIFGGIYLAFGLLTSIIVHFTFDLILFALPLFVSTAPGAWLNQTSVIILGLIPLLIVIRARLQTRGWHELKEEDYNRAWLPPEKIKPTPISLAPQEVISFKPKIFYGIICAGVAGLGLWAFTTKFHNDAPALTISRNAAQDCARELLQKQFNVMLAKPKIFPVQPEDEPTQETTSWTPLTQIVAYPGMQDRFIWQEGDKTLYKNLLGSYLVPPYIFVRFVRFKGTVVERIEEYRALITQDGTVLRTIHLVPETFPGKILSEEEARIIAHQALQTHFNLDPAELKEISAVADKLPNRKNWTFTFSDKKAYPLETGDARISINIAGDEVVDYYRYIHVPEQWERNEQKEKNLKDIFGMICKLLLVLLAIPGIFILFMRSRMKIIPIRSFISLFLIFLCIGIGNNINSWPAIMAIFNTSEPFYNQLFRIVGFIFIQIIVFAASFTFVITRINQWQSRTKISKNGHSLLLGTSLGLIITGLIALIQKYAPSLSPLWANYAPVGTYIPFITATTSYFMSYLMLTALLLLLFILFDHFTKGWNTNKALGIFLIFVLGLLLTGIQEITTIPFLLLSGSLFGIILCGAHYFVIRFDQSYIPLITAIYVIAEAAQQAVLFGYPTAYLGTIGASIAIVCTAFYWFKKLN